MSMNMPKNKERKIPCCIIDDHCDFIPFLHSLWRAKKISSTNLLLFHIDSHPDLIPPPTVNSNDLTNLTVLYNLLEQEGSISEFILPLFINQHLTSIIWLHQTFCQQFSNGEYQFLIGNINPPDTSSSPSSSSALTSTPTTLNRTPRVGIGINLLESYYLDEGLVYDLHELDQNNLTSIQMISCDDQSFQSFDQPPLSSSPSSPSPSSSSSSTKWILDICLDYFSVCNPFLLQLETHLQSVPPEEYSSSFIISTLQKTISVLPFRSLHSTNCLYQATLQERREERILFQHLLFEILSLPLIPVDSSLLTQFLQLFKCSCCPHVTDSSSSQPLSSSHPSSSSPSSPSQAQTQAQAQAQLFLEMISKLSLSTRQTILQLDIFLIATLPHQNESWESILHTIERLKGILTLCLERFQSPPEVVCIARSDGDGYTDETLVDRIQEAVLTMLQEELFQSPSPSSSSSSCPSCSLEVYDIRTDCFIKCRQLFLSTELMSSRKRKLLESSGFKFDDSTSGDP